MNQTVTVFVVEQRFQAMIKTVWPSGLRRWLKAPVRKGVGSNPTALNAYRFKLHSAFTCTQGELNRAMGGHRARLLLRSGPQNLEPKCQQSSRPLFLNHSSRVSRVTSAGSLNRAATCGLQQSNLQLLVHSQDSLAEWSKALASGASPQGRGFEPHSSQCL